MIGKYEELDDIICKTRRTQYQYLLGGNETRHFSSILIGVWLCVSNGLWDRKSRTAWIETTFFSSDAAAWVLLIDNRNLLNQVLPTFRWWLASNPWWTSLPTTTTTRRSSHHPPWHRHLPPSPPSPPSDPRRNNLNPRKPHQYSVKVGKDHQRKYYVSFHHQQPMMIMNMIVIHVYGKLHIIVENYGKERQTICIRNAWSRY